MTTPRPDATCRCGHAYDRHHGVADSDFRGHVECMGQAGSDPCDCTGYAPTLPRPGFGDAVPEAKRQRSDALTAESLALLEAVRAAVLDPAIAKMLAPDGRPQLVALVSIALLEHDLPRIEAAARADAVERHREQTGCITADEAVQVDMARLNAENALADAERERDALREALVDIAAFARSNYPEWWADMVTSMARAALAPASASREEVGE